jgi:hypothetical protein
MLKIKRSGRAFRAVNGKTTAGRARRRFWCFCPGAA